MSPEQIRFSLFALCGVLLIATVICAEETGDKELLENQPNDAELSNGNDVFHWPWPKRKFKCPTAWGAYPDPDNCAFFYICVAKIGTRTRCPLMYHFCKVKRMCLPMLIAQCDDGTEVTQKEETTTEKETQFICPEEKGKFPYPHDCSKYYACKNDQSTLESCPDSKLFHGIKKKCMDAEKVHCGSRFRPTDATPFLEETTQGIVETSPEQEKVTSDHPEEITHSDEETTFTFDDTTHDDVETTPFEEAASTNEETTHKDEETTSNDEKTTPPDEKTTLPDEETTTLADETTPPDEETTLPDEKTTPSDEETTPPDEESSSPEDTTTHKTRVTAPDTDCDADDLDCIIDDLGETPDWFVCPEDLGSYPHPTSTKLFIFCLNWKPLVKKCGQDLVFSEEHMTCVAPPESDL